MSSLNELTTLVARLRVIEDAIADLMGVGREADAMALTEDVDAMRREIVRVASIHYDGGPAL